MSQDNTESEDSTSVIYSSLEEAMWGDKTPLKWYEVIYYRITRKYDNFKYWVKGLIQTVKYGFPDWHWYEFKSWHADEVTPRLKRFRSNLHSYPSGLTEEKWAEYLDAMIWSFEHFDDRVDLEYSEDYDHRYKKTIKNDGRVTYTQLNKTGKVSFDKIEAHKERVQYGLKLFAEHYCDLWD